MVRRAGPSPARRVNGMADVGRGMKGGKRTEPEARSIARWE